MEITINAKQIIAMIWTLIAVVISLIVALTLDSILPWSYWWVRVVAFFGVFLLITLPVYLLIALWATVSRPETE
jgi:hypothetical protein